jgi:type IV pilus assembly protein PilA
MMPAGKRTGRAIEFLVMIAIISTILIILAAALPGVTNDGRYAREMAAAKAIATIRTAESQYCSQFGRYATSLAQLGPPASGAPGPNSADLIDRELATGEKGGFKFVLRRTPTGYALSVTPTASGTSGTHTYYSD